MPLRHDSASLSPTHAVVLQVLAQLGFGVMFATLATIAYAYLQFDESALRVRLLLLGLQGILVAGASILVFCSLYLGLDVDELDRRDRKAPVGPLPHALAA